MSKYNVGDKVRIKKDLDDSDRDVVYSMLKYEGKIATVTRLDDDEVDTEYCYRIDLDDGVHYWTDKMIKLFIKEYTIHNLINDFPEQTEFTSKDTKYKIFLGRLYWYNTNIIMPMWLPVESNVSLKQILDMKFTKVEEPKLKPMTFEEVVRTGNNIKYEYDNFAVDYFCTLQNIFGLLMSPMYSSKTVSDIILKGTWYAEGVYE